MFWHIDEDAPSRITEIGGKRISERITHFLRGSLVNEKIGIEKWIGGISYLLAMGVCGTVLVAFGSTLKQLAENVGEKTTDIGSVFITRGVGAVFGALASSKLYMWFRGNRVLTCSLLLIATILALLPFNTSVILLHFYFFFLGIGTAVTDTGCQIMTRKLHGKAAGPWLGANTVSFGISGTLVPLIEIFTHKLSVQYLVIAGLVFIITLLICFGPDPERDGRLAPPPKKENNNKIILIHYNVEMNIAIMVFWVIGGGVTLNAYLDTYVDITGVLNPLKDSSLLLVLWINIALGRLIGVADQQFINTKSLINHLSLFLIGGFISISLVLIFPKNGDCLWIAVAFYGLWNGPCLGYCYDLNNRITYSTEKSMSIVMFGLNFGASLVPYLTTVVWNRFGGPITLPVVVFISMFIPLPLLFIAPYLSYDPNINPRLIDKLLPNESPNLSRINDNLAANRIDSKDSDNPLVLML